MTEDEGLAAMVDACIAAYEAVRKHGTSEMLLVASILLQMAGQQIAGEIKDNIDEATDKGAVQLELDRSSVGTSFTRRE